MKFETGVIKTTKEEIKDYWAGTKYKIPLYNDEWKLFQSSQIKLDIDNSLKGTYSLKSDNAKQRTYVNKTGVQLNLIKRGSTKSTTRKSIFV